jgi:16S rRNA (guanine1207-N2)-methyltransferase
MTGVMRVLQASYMTALQTLFHPFEAGLVPLPSSGTRGIVLNAQPGMRWPEGVGAMLVQGFRPLFLPLQRSGHEVAPEPKGEGYDLAMVIAGRHRRQNEIWVAEALACTRPGGTILIGGGKTEGAASLRKRMGELLPLAGSASKYHGVAFWLERPEQDAALGAIDALTPQSRLVAGRFHTAPGGFSADGVEVGSRLLADNLPPDLSGHVADFCAGWGYLSVRMAEGLPGVTSIALYEADFASLEAAQRNLAAASPEMTFHWHDLAAEPVAARYDAIVMNPPFHQGRAAEPDLGLRMIAAAKAALKPGGRLFLVANRELPYEKMLADGFRTHGEVVRDAGYKVLWAAR